ncbi:MAG: glycosyltransferase family 2 protein [Myxococcota bacterium]
MKLLVVIVNYKTAEMTLESVASALRETQHIPETKIAVVDNDSGDGSLEKLRQGKQDAGWGESVQILASPWNGGFAWGNNYAIRAALQGQDRPEYVYLLNSDAFPDQNAVAELVNYLDAHPKVGIAGSFIHGDDGETHKTAFRFPSLGSELEGPLGIGIVSRLLENYIVSPDLPTSTQQVNWLAGASMLIRTQVFDEIGLMDDGYFLYYEETDFCLRAARAGWPTAYVVESSVTHIGSVSTGIQDISKPTPEFWYASRHRYFLKNYGRATLWAANALYIGAGLIRRLRSALLRRPSHEPEGHMRGFLRFNLRLTPAPSGHPPRPANMPAAPALQNESAASSASPSEGDVATASGSAHA